MEPLAFDQASTIPDQRRPCAGATTAGMACRGRALPDGEFCFAHAPELAARRVEARERGGRNHSRTARARAAMPADLGGVMQRLHSALDRLDRGELEPRIASAMASLAGAIVRTWELASLEARLARMEKLLGEYGDPEVRQ
jgi:hypothetical protein